MKETDLLCLTAVNKMESVILFCSVFRSVMLPRSPSVFEDISKLRWAGGARFQRYFLSSHSKLWLCISFILKSFKIYMSLNTCKVNYPTVAKHMS